MVKVIHLTQELEAQRASEKTSVGFVPTMGNLHRGHISLLERALAEHETVYFSIFVNPKQFGPNEDFNRYPRTLQDDLKLIEEAASRFPTSQVVVYSPANPAEVFPHGSDLSISVLGISRILEGEMRPGHFDGVATVVHRLFDLVKPRTAYFGLKDYQQYLVIRQMVKDLGLPIQITGMPIVREREGLALSSRNQYLTPEQKSRSLILIKTLKELGRILQDQRGHIHEAKSYIREVLKDPQWNYLELRDAENLSEDISHSKHIIILAVYQLGTTRLLDNLLVELK